MISGPSEQIPVRLTSAVSSQYLNSVSLPLSPVVPDLARPRGPGPVSTIQLSCNGLLISGEIHSLGEGLCTHLSTVFAKGQTQGCQEPQPSWALCPSHQISLSSLLLLSPAAVFENLDSSDVMETPAFPLAMNLLEVLDPCLC